MNGHEFQPFRSVDNVAEYWTAGCSCGWVGAYSHAFAKYAEEDHVFHVFAVALGRSRVARS